MKKLLLPLLLFFGFTIATAQNPADLETSFGPYPGFNDQVNTIAKQADGKILVGGNFTKYKGAACNYLVRLLSDGTVDTNFNPTFNAAVTKIKLQGDGKIFAMGSFFQYNGISTGSFIRLNSDGTKDNSFVTGTGFYEGGASVSDLVALPDGKILIGGSFSSFNTISCANLVRLNANGSVDTAFDTGTGFNNRVNAIAVQSDGKMVIVGNFTNYRGYTRNGIIRLNTDGTVDLTFSIGVGFSGGPQKVLLQTDSKIVVFGGFYSYKNETASAIIRLLPDGNKDTTFITGTGFSGINSGFNYIDDVVMDSSGNFVLAGALVGYNGVGFHSSVMRIKPDGSLDTFLHSSSNGHAYGIALQDDGKFILGGTSFIARFENNGDSDATFDTGRGFYLGSYYGLHSLMQPDGKLIVSGYTRYNLAADKGMMRFNVDGTKDSSFTLDNFRSAYASHFVLQTDGKILAYGYFRLSNPAVDVTMIRLNPDGSLDSYFYPPSGTVYVVAVQPDGKILLAGGPFLNSNGDTFGTGLMRINADGTPDYTFDIGDALSSQHVLAIAVQPDGKILLGGDFPTFAGQQLQRIVRLLPSGSVDPTFNPGEGFDDGGVQCFKLLPDGKILAGGAFNTYDVVSSYCIVRINPDGSRDNTFNPGIAARGVTSIALQADGKIITSGYFDGTTKSLVRFEANGTIDSGFDIGTGFINATGAQSSSIDNVWVQPSGQIYAVGNFIEYHNVSSPYLVRLHGGNNLATAAFSDEKMVLYPNPATDLIYVNVPSGVLGGYEIYDLTGKLLLRGDGLENGIAVQSLSRGMYLIKVKGRDTETYNAKFLKE